MLHQSSDYNKKYQNVPQVEGGKLLVMWMKYEAADP